MKQLLIIAGLMAMYANAQIIEPPVQNPDIVIAVDHEEDEYCEFPEVAAEFPGGMDSLYAYFERTIQYPLEARELGDQGKVYVEAYIDTTGKVYNIKVLRGVSKPLDREVKRLMRVMPLWKPAENQGRKCKSRIIFPVAFIIDNALGYTAQIHGGPRVKIDTLPEDMIYEYPDEPAKYKEGFDNLLRCINDNVQLPDSIGENQGAVKVILRFVIERDGTVSFVQTMKSTQATLNKPYEEAISKTTGWVPAKVAGKTVRSWFVLPINIHLE